MDDDPYSHLALKTEITSAYVEGRDVQAICGVKGDPMTFDGRMTYQKPLCPKCKELEEKHGRRLAD